MNSVKYCAEEIHVRIKSIRTSHGFSQDYVARKIGISQNAYSRLELGVSKLSIDRMLKIAFILGVSPIELLKPTPPAALAS
ncbi:MAG: helix-turn-helix transcriptional regulator [Flavobacteriales bacterium]